MRRRGKGGEALAEAAAENRELALELAKDRRFRAEVAEAVRHAAAARQQARRRLGTLAGLTRLATDEHLRHELDEAQRNVRSAWERLQAKKRRHRSRKTLLAFVAGAGALAAVVPRARTWLKGSPSPAGVGTGSGVRVVQEAIEVDVPVSTAYNQWTQFEEFPRFMEGVDEVRQLDDTRLHWVATVAGKRAEWDAKITEQHPDRQITWVSEDGKTTRGTVSFEERGPERTRIELSMSYRAEGVRELAGSAAGLDARRVRGDLGRFKQLIEERGTESGAWRGEVSQGQTR